MGSMAVSCRRHGLCGLLAGLLLVAMGPAAASASEVTSSSGPDVATNGISAPASSAAAESRLQVVPLRHQPAPRLLPLLRPLLVEGEALTGSGFQLVLRVPESRVADWLEIIRQMDQPSESLLITVFAGPASAIPEISGTDRQVWRTRPREERWHSLQVLEGETVGVRLQQEKGGMVPEILPVPGVPATWISLAPREEERVASFRAQLSTADVLWLEVFYSEQRVNGSSGGAQQQVATVVQGRLGEWLPLRSSESAHRPPADAVVIGTRRPQVWPDVYVRVQRYSDAR